jgi:hypothetical protein
MQRPRPARLRTGAYRRRSGKEHGWAGSEAWLPQGCLDSGREIVTCQGNESINHQRGDKRRLAQPMAEAPAISLDAKKGLLMRRPRGPTPPDWTGL